MVRTFLVLSSICLFTLCYGAPAAAQADDAELSEENIPAALPDDVFEVNDPETEASDEAFLEEEEIEDRVGDLDMDADGSPLTDESEPEDAGLESAQFDNQSENAASADVVDEIVIGGNDRVEEEAIRIRTSALPGTGLNRDTVDADIRSIYDMGFFHNVEARFEQENGRSVLTYWVSERPLIREVRFEGNKKIDKEALEVALKIHPRTILNPVRIRRGIEDAKKAYEEKGYLDADISYRAEQVGPGETAVTFTIEEQKPTGVAQIHFEGNETFEDSRLQSIMATRKKNFYPAS